MTIFCGSKDSRVLIGKGEFDQIDHNKPIELDVEQARVRTNIPCDYLCILLTCPYKEEALAVP